VCWVFVVCVCVWCVCVCVGRVCVCVCVGVWCVCACVCVVCVYVCVCGVCVWVCVRVCGCVCVVWCVCVWCVCVCVCGVCVCVCVVCVWSPQGYTYIFQASGLVHRLVFWKQHNIPKNESASFYAWTDEVDIRSFETAFGSNIKNWTQ